MVKNKSVKMSIIEASEYFDEHDIFENGSAKEVAGIKFRFKKKKYVGLDSGLYKKIQVKAKKMGVTEDSLIQDWLNQKVKELKVGS